MIKSVKSLQNEKAGLVARAQRSANTIAVRTRRAAMKAYRDADDVSMAVEIALMGMEDLLTDAMVAAHLAGRLRVLLRYGNKLLREAKGFGPYDDATTFMKNRLQLSPFQLEQLENIYGDTATHVTRIASDKVESAAQKAVSKIVNEGMHIRQGMPVLRDTLITNGVNSPHPWLIETLVRTQIEVAYGAGRWNANQDPAIAESLWGYQYMTVGDDRVRENHAAMDGARYPKDDAFWAANWPPNGFNCRCEVVEIFKDDAEAAIIEAPKTVMVADKIVVVTADAGWQINHGKVYADMIGLVAV